MIPRLLLGLLLTLSVALAQTVAKVKAGTADYKAITLAAKAKFQTAAAFPIKTPSGTVQRAGAWVFLRDQLAFVDPKHVGDGEGMALLKLQGKKWKVVDWTVGSGGMEDLASDWTKKYKLPKGLAR